MPQAAIGDSEHSYCTTGGTEARQDAIDRAFGGVVFLCRPRVGRIRVRWEVELKGKASLERVCTLPAPPVKGVLLPPLRSGRPLTGGAACG
jgi:hypothetical protein